MRTSSPVPQADAPTVRIAGPEDYPLLLSFLAGSELDHPPNDLPRDIAGTLRCPAARIFVAELNGRLIGTVTGSWSGRNGEIRYLWLAPCLRGTIWAAQTRRALMHAAMDYLSKHGMTRALAHVRNGDGASARVRLFELEYGAYLPRPNPYTIVFPIAGARLAADWWQSLRTIICPGVTECAL